MSKLTIILPNINIFLNEFQLSESIYGNSVSHSSYNNKININFIIYAKIRQPYIYKYKYLLLSFLNISNYFENINLNQSKLILIIHYSIISAYSMVLIFIENYQF